MDKIGLKRDVLDAIKSDPILHGKVAYALGMSPMSMAKLLYANDARLTQATVINVLKRHLKGMKDSDLLCKMQVTG